MIFKICIVCSSLLFLTIYIIIMIIIIILLFLFLLLLLLLLLLCIFAFWPFDLYHVEYRYIWFCYWKHQQLFHGKISKMVIYWDRWETTGGSIAYLHPQKLIPGILAHLLRMVSWNLNTFRCGGDYTPQSSSDKVSQDPYKTFWTQQIGGLGRCVSSFSIFFRGIFRFQLLVLGDVNVDCFCCREILPTVKLVVWLYH